jgi:hypothetical protein
MWDFTATSMDPGRRYTPRRMAHHRCSSIVQQWFGGLSKNKVQILSSHQMVLVIIDHFIIHKTRIKPNHPIALTLPSETQPSLVE